MSLPFCSPHPPQAGTRGRGRSITLIIPTRYWENLFLIAFQPSRSVAPSSKTGLQYALFLKFCYLFPRIAPELNQHLFRMLAEVRSGIPYRAGGLAEPYRETT